MKHAFEKAGITAAGVEFKKACALYFNKGGTLAEFDRIGAEVRHEMGKIGQNTNVREDRMPAADLSHPMPEGQCPRVQQEPLSTADGQPKPSEGHLSCVQQDYSGRAPARSPIPSEGHPQSVHRDHKARAPAGNPNGGGDQIPRVHQDQRMIVPSADPFASKKASLRPPIKATDSVPSARDLDDAFRRALTRDRMQNAAIWLDLNKTSDGRYWSKICPYEFEGMERDARTVHHIKFVFGEFNHKQRNTPLGKLLTPDLQKKLAHRVDLMEGRRV